MTDQADSKGRGSIEDLELLHTDDIARLFGMTEAAVRAAVVRDHQRPEHMQALPTPFRQGARLAWRRSSVDAWISERERLARLAGVDR